MSYWGGNSNSKQQKSREDGWDEVEVVCSTKDCKTHVVIIVPDGGKIDKKATFRCFECSGRIQQNQNERILRLEEEVKATTKANRDLVKSLQDMRQKQGEWSKQLKELEAEMKRTFEDAKKAVDEVASETEEKLKESSERVSKLETTGTSSQPSFASLFKNLPNNPPLINAATLRKTMLIEERESADRRKNLKITGKLPAPGNEKIEFTEMAMELNVDISGIQFETKRLEKEGKPDILLICVGEAKRNEFIRKAKDLKDSLRWNQTFVKPHYTQAEEEVQYQLRKLKRERKEAEPGKDWIIRHGRVVERKSAEQQTR